MSIEEAVLLLISCGVVLLIQACAFFSLMRTCAVLKKENRIYRRFFEQQYRLESDCMDACCDMIRESVDATNTADQNSGQYIRPPCRLQKRQ